jgi:hypothetical protein
MRDVAGHSLEMEGETEMMRTKYLGRRGGALALLCQALAVLAVAAVMPARAASEPACTWVDSAGSGDFRYGDIDLDAYYYSALVRRPDANSTVRLKIEGQYPAARYFSFIAYRGAASAVVDSLTDYQIVPDAGSASPYADMLHLDPATAAGGHYTIQIVYSAKPSNPAPNTLYLDPALLNGRNALLIYRIYNPFPGVTDPSTADVPLPQILMETDQGDVPVAANSASLYCAYWQSTVEQGGPLIISTVSLLADFGFPTRWTPQFALYHPNDAPLGARNVDNQYMGAAVSRTRADLVLMRARAPTYTGQPGVEPQMRHWSVCENNAVGQTFDCVEDSEVAVDADGFFNIVMSSSSKKPATATHDYGFDWLDFGDNGAPQTGVIIYRQQLDSPDFAQSMAAVGDGDPATVMGDYDPQLTYCSATTFQQHTTAGESPADVFKACKAGNSLFGR